MKINETIKIYQDGKFCRDIPATVLSIRSGGVKVRFIVDDEEVTVWCRKRSKYGIYEAIGWNYWIVPTNVWNVITKY